RHGDERDFGSTVDPVQSGEGEQYSHLIRATAAGHCGSRRFCGVGGRSGVPRRDYGARGAGRQIMFLGVPKSMVVRLGWVTFSYGTVLFLRLLNNVILARILAPPILGLMAIVNAIRTGVELLSDVGIMQNI